ncbi:MAG: alpha-amylase family glycosyl hydrolase [Ilumatobacteraceae bacterium]
MTAVPDDVLVVAAEHLHGVADHEAEMFGARLVRWWPDLRAGLAAVYEPAVAAELGQRLVALAARGFAERDADLKRLDLQRLLEPDWFQHPRMFGYAAYADRFAGDLRGVSEHLPYLHELGVTYLHLMPLLLPRPSPNDGGYAVADYRAVRPDLGTVADLRALARTARRHGVSLCLDLVLNHVAREHAWAGAARAGDERYRRYFHVFPDRSRPDEYERSLLEVFPDFAPGNFTWDDDLAGWVWTTFNEWQWDVDWSNPDVVCEYADIVLHLANLGVEVLRLDAVAFLWKRLGTTSQNQPEVHAITQVLRATARIACPALVFLAEAIVSPAELVHYLGTGERHGKVSDLAYHNSLMVQLWSMLASREVALAVEALRATDEVPTTTAWITYVRGHDDIGWAVDDADAAAVGLSGSAHRAFLSDWYSGDFATSTARGLVFQHNEETGDRRISGTLASLAGLDDALASGDPARVDLAIERILLVHTVILGWGGVPVLWMGDEVALRNDPCWAEHPDAPDHADDNRWVHRPRMPWDVAARRHEPGTVEKRVFDGIVHRVRVRAHLPHLRASTRSEVLDAIDPGVFAVLRRHPVGPLLAVYNVTAEPRALPVDRLRAAELDPAAVVDALTSRPPPVDASGALELPPYAARWLVSSSWSGLGLDGQPEP